MRMINFIKSKFEKGSAETDLDYIKSPISRLDLIDNLTIRYTQKKVSDLDYDIISALSVDKEKARYLAVRACKIFCFWLELYSKNITSMNFADFFKFGYDNIFIDGDNCSLLKTQEATLELLKNQGLILSSEMIEINNFEQFKKYNLSLNWTGTIRIETEKDKFHSIPSYNLNGNIKISDISFRGQRVNAFKYVNPKNFRYFTSIQEK